MKWIPVGRLLWRCNSRPIPGDLQRFHFDRTNAIEYEASYIADEDSCELSPSEQKQTRHEGKEEAEVDGRPGSGNKKTSRTPTPAWPNMEDIDVAEMIEIFQCHKSLKRITNERLKALRRREAISLDVPEPEIGPSSTSEENDASPSTARKVSASPTPNWPDMIEIEAVDTIDIFKKERDLNRITDEQLREVKHHQLKEKPVTRVIDETVHVNISKSHEWFLPMHSKSLRERRYPSSPMPGKRKAFIFETTQWPNMKDINALEPVDVFGNDRSLKRITDEQLAGMKNEGPDTRITRDGEAEENVDVLASPATSEEKHKLAHKYASTRASQSQ